MVSVILYISKGKTSDVEAEALTRAFLGRSGSGSG